VETRITYNARDDFFARRLAPRSRGNGIALVFTRESEIVKARQRVAEIPDSSADGKVLRGNEEGGRSGQFLCCPLNDRRADVL